MMWGKSVSIGRSLSIGLAASALFAAGALAADIPPPPLAAPAPPPPPPMAAPAFDWSGPYVGFYGGGFFDGGFAFAFAGIQAGYNVIAGERILFGIEGQLGAAFDFAPATTVEAALSARVGAVLGERALLYGEGGIWWLQGAPVLLWTAGGGLEFALGERTSLFGEANVVGNFNGGCCAFTVEGGFNFHPGN